MLRSLYVLLLRLHPKKFQARFGGEMLLTFEEAQQTEGAMRLLVDALVSLLRQRVLRGRSKEWLRSQASEGACAGSARLSDMPQLGLSPYRLLQGGLISLTLFCTVFFCVRGGHPFRGSALLGRDGAPGQTEPLTPSDLATLQAECAKGALHSCVSDVKKTGTTPDEMMDLQPPLAQKQDSHELLVPSGRFGIGRVMYEWAENHGTPGDQSKAEQRIVFVWYPTRDEKEAAGHSFTSVWNYSRANQAFFQTHTLDKPPIATGTHLFPVLLFYPAMNSSSAAYTTQIENLVSHGYVVASLEPHIDRSTVSFTNGQLLPLAADLRSVYTNRKGSSSESLLGRALDRAAVRQTNLAADLSFVLDKLTDANGLSKDAAPFAGRLDLSRVGAFGHSDGGTAAGLACQADGRIRACSSEDGWTVDGPEPGTMSAQISAAKPFLWINIPLVSPENQQLAYLRMQRAKFSALEKRSQLLADRELEAQRSEAYRVTVRMPEVTDSFFTDGPFVWSMYDTGASVTERNFLVIVNTYVRAFFDHFLRGGPSDLLNGSALPLRDVEVKHYAARQSRAFRRFESRS